MARPTENETWVIDTGDKVIRNKARVGIECITPWERLVYCLWVADYGMRNAGDLDTAADWYADFQTDAVRLAAELSLRQTQEAFSLPSRDLERQYFDRFESICDEIRASETRATGNV